jgi:hypothetical protein
VVDEFISFNGLQHIANSNHQNNAYLRFFIQGRIIQCNEYLSLVDQRDKKEQ